jgi:hypothetical protein
VGFEEVVVGCGGGAIKLSNLVNRDCGLIIKALILTFYTFEDFYLPSFQKINSLLLVLKDRWDLKLRGNFKLSSFS